MWKKGKRRFFHLFQWTCFFLLSQNCHFYSYILIVCDVKFFVCLESFLRKFNCAKIEVFAAVNLVFFQLVVTELLRSKVRSSFGTNLVPLKFLEPFFLFPKNWILHCQNPNLYLKKVCKSENISIHSLPQDFQGLLIFGHCNISISQEKCVALEQTSLFNIIKGLNFHLFGKFF